MHRQVAAVKVGSAPQSDDPAGVGEVGFDRFTDSQVIEAGIEALALRGLIDLAERRQIVLSVGDLDVVDQAGALLHVVGAPAHEVTGRAHACWIDVGNREQAAEKQAADTFGVKAIVPALGAVGPEASQAAECLNGLAHIALMRKEHSTAEGLQTS
jgi:hypothetical protein